MATGRFIDGGGSGGRPARPEIGNWGEVKEASCRTMLGIALEDADIFNVPLIATDPYGRFLRGPNGFPLLMRPKQRDRGRQPGGADCHRRLAEDRARVP